MPKAGIGLNTDLHKNKNKLTQKMLDLTHIDGLTVAAYMTTTQT